MAKRPSDGKPSPNWGGSRDQSGRKSILAKDKHKSFTISIPQGLVDEILREADRLEITRGEVVEKKFFWRGG